MSRECRGPWKEWVVQFWKLRGDLRIGGGGQGWAGSLAGGFQWAEAGALALLCEVLCLCTADRGSFGQRIPPSLPPCLLGWPWLLREGGWGWGRGVDGRWREVGPAELGWGGCVCGGGSELGSRSLQATQAWGTPGEMQRRGGLLVLLLWERGRGSFWAGQVWCLGRLPTPAHPPPRRAPCSWALGSAWSCLLTGLSFLGCVPASCGSPPWGLCRPERPGIAGAQARAHGGPENRPASRGWVSKGTRPDGLQQPGLGASALWSGPLVGGGRSGSSSVRQRHRRWETRAGGKAPAPAWAVAQLPSGRPRTGGGGGGG
jgi:hypothetical protein